MLIGTTWVEIQVQMVDSLQKTFKMEQNYIWGIADAVTGAFGNVKNKHL